MDRAVLDLVSFYQNEIRESQAARDALDHLGIHSPEDYPDFAVSGEKLEPGEKPVEFRGIKTATKYALRYGPEDLPTQEDVSRMVEAASTPRDRALVAILYESAARLGEFLGLRIGSVERATPGLKIHVDGKTGKRPIMLVNAVPLLSAWLGYHPLRDRSDAPLWVSTGTRRNGKDDAHAARVTPGVVWRGTAVAQLAHEYLVHATARLLDETYPLEGLGQPRVPRLRLVHEDVVHGDAFWEPAGVRHEEVVGLPLYVDRVEPRVVPVEVVEIVVDCYDERERAMGWYYYLEGALTFPFGAICTGKRAILPLREGDLVEVIGMAPEEECEREMFVMVRWERDGLGFPLSQLEPVRGTDDETCEAVEDWLYWVGMGYRF